MAMHENDIDEWAGDLFERARGVGGGEPAWRPDMASAAAERAHRTRRVRMTGALSALAVVAVGVGAYTLVPGGSSSAVSPGATTAAPTTAGSHRASKDGVTGYMDLGAAYAFGALADPPSSPATAGRTPGPPPKVVVPASAMPMVAGIIAALDPGHRHLRAMWTPKGTTQVNVGTDPVALPYTALSGFSTWTPNGDASALWTGGDDRQAFGELVFEALPPMKTAPGKDNAIPNSPCGISAGQFHSDRANTFVWSACAKSRQPDGSVIETTHASVPGGGTVAAAFRIFPDNAYLDVVASNYRVYSMDSGKSTMAGDMQSVDAGEHIGAAMLPNPFTEAALRAALSGADVHELGR